MNKPVTAPSFIISIPLLTKHWQHVCGGMAEGFAHICLWGFIVGSTMFPSIRHMAMDIHSKLWFSHPNIWVNVHGWFNPRVQIIDDCQISLRYPQTSKIPWLIICSSPKLLVGISHLRTHLPWNIWKIWTLISFHPGLLPNNSTGLVRFFGWCRLSRSSVWTSKCLKMLILQTPKEQQDNKSWVEQFQAEGTDRYKLLAHVTTLLHIGLHWNIIEYLQKMDPIFLAGWWFGTWILFFHSVGNGKSSQLTKS